MTPRDFVVTMYRVGGIVAAAAILIGVHLEHFFRPIRIMLKRRQRLDQAPAPPMNEQFRLHAPLRITEPLQHLRPTVGLCSEVTGGLT